MLLRMPICKSHKLKHNCTVLCSFINSSHIVLLACSHSAEEDGKVKCGRFLIVPKAVSWKIRGWLFLGISVLIVYGFE